MFICVRFYPCRIVQNEYAYRALGPETDVEDGKDDALMVEDSAAQVAGSESFLLVDVVFGA